MKKILFGSIAVMSLMACNESIIVAPEPAKVTTVSLNVTAAQIEVGRTVTITPTVKDQRDSVMTGKTVTWSSNNTPVATVSSTGVVTGVTKGQATIMATVDGKVATATVFVTDATVATVSLTATVPPTFYVGQTVQATATPRDANNNALNAFSVSWVSSAPAVASVSNGLITALSAGATTITASAGGKTATLNVVVTLVPVASVTLSTTKPAQIGRSISVTAALKNNSGSTLTSAQRSFVWASADTSVATISETGVITGISAGTTIVSCVVENKVGLLSVTVSEVGISRIVVSPDSSDVAVGVTKQLHATAFDTDSVALSTAALNGRRFIWASSDNAKAVVSNTGLVTAITAGVANVTATVGAKTGTGIIVVVP